jgi:hypothetical protein
MFGGVTYKKLFGSCCVASYIKKPASYAHGRNHRRIINRTCLVGVLIGHFPGIILKLFETVYPNLIITDVYGCMKLWNLDIDPIGIRWLLLKKTAILNHLGINRVFKRVGIIRLFEALVLVFRKGYPEISSSFGGVYAVATSQQKRYPTDEAQDFQKTKFNAVEFHFSQQMMLFFRPNRYPYSFYPATIRF